MYAAFASLIPLAQNAGGKGSGQGDSATMYVIVLAVLGLVVIGAALLILRARGTDQSQSPRNSHATEPIGERGPTGHPMHVDPDPDHLAGGRARMTDPLKDA